MDWKNDFKETTSDIIANRVANESWVSSQQQIFRSSGPSSPKIQGPMAQMLCAHCQALYLRWNIEEYCRTACYVLAKKGEIHPIYRERRYIREMLRKELNREPSNKEVTEFMSHQYRSQNNE